MQRVCVIGLGPIGNRHADLYQENPLAELVGVCDILHDRADAAAARLGVPAFYDVETMLKAVHPDICSVATGGEEYGSDHYLPTMQALEFGCHVLCEKPISNNIREAEEMVAKAKEKNLCFGIDFNHRFNTAHRLAKKWVEEGRLGTLLFVNMSMWIKNPRESSPYFQIKALHPHTVDIMRYFCGDVEAVHCFATKAPGRKIWSTAQFNLRFKNGVVGSLTGSYDIERGHPMERCEVAGTGGRFVIEDMFREVTLYPAGNLEKTVYTNPIFGGMGDFSDT
ncbi:MAG: Gfo/Idh/MocA family oxidoreductase, partial [Armatimonadota bacterium]|nr:Gfo/Idh/MocA family oxidoreductase [Armatimonadota bacterium]